MTSLRSRINFHLCSNPPLYKWILRLKGKANIDKLVFLSLVARGDVVLDIGANEGYYTTLFSHLVGEKGSVHSFEPVPPTFELLSGTVRQTVMHRNVSLVNAAVGEAGQQPVTMYVPGDVSGQASVKRHNAGAWRDCQDVRSFQAESTSIDEYVAAHGIGKIDFIKVDVEGYELMCLKGASRTLIEFGPLLFLEVCDLWSADFGYEPTDLVKFLQSCGYVRFLLVTDTVRECAGAVLNVRQGQAANLICAKSAHVSRLERLWDLS